jgi:hypothetical protein
MEVKFNAVLLLMCYTSQFISHFQKCVHFFREEPLSRPMRWSWLEAKLILHQVPTEVDKIWKRDVGGTIYEMVTL